MRKGVSALARISPMTDSFSKDTDGFMARHFDRKISGTISRLLLKTPVTPNQITVAVTLIGILAGYLFSQYGFWPKVFGSLVFLLTSILDGCDGEVARAKRMTSKLGGWLDLWGDNVVHVAVFYGIGVGLYEDTGDLVYRQLGMLATAGTLVSASLASYQTWRKGQSSFTSVSGDIKSVGEEPLWRRLLIKVSDELARRDFVYGVVVLAFIGHLEWFLWACAIGSVIYALVLGVLCLFTRP